MINFEDLLGRSNEEVLLTPPLSQWAYKISPFYEPDDPDEFDLYLTFPGQGLEMSFEEDRTLGSVFFHARKLGGFTMQRPIVEFETSQADTRMKFGTPLSFREASTHELLGEINPHDLFLVQTDLVNIQYTSDKEAIELITLMRFDVGKRFVVAEETDVH
ncbi:MAG: hypothetical protein AAGD04_09085 [Pseudomonadota bacterium]